MIKNKTPITFAEAKALLEDQKTDKAEAVCNFIKKFTKLSAADALKLKQKLQSLDILKLKEEDFVKLIDFAPKDADDVRKIFSGSDLKLDQDEIAKLLGIFNKK